MRALLVALLLVAGCHTPDQYGLAASYGEGRYGRAETDGWAVTPFVSWDAGERRRLTVLELEAREREVDAALAAKYAPPPKEKDPEPARTNEAPESYRDEIALGGATLALLEMLRRLGVFHSYRAGEGQGNG